MLEALLYLTGAIINVLAVYGALRLLWDFTGVVFPNREPPPLEALPDEDVYIAMEQELLDYAQQQASELVGGDDSEAALW